MDQIPRKIFIWSFFNALAICLVTIFYLLEEFTITIISYYLIMSILFLVLLGIVNDYWKNYGVANLLSMFRFSVVMIAFLVSDNLILLGISLILNLTIDFIDGPIARKLNEDNAFGSALDNEIDSILVYVAILYLYSISTLNILGPVAGLLRYIYIIWIFVMKYTITTEAASLRAKAIGTNFNVAIILVYLFESIPLFTGYFYVSILAVLTSFGKDMFGLHLINK